MDNDFSTLIDNLADELDSNSNLTVIDFQTPLAINKKEKEAAKKITPSSIFDFHQNLNGLIIEWKPKKKQNPDIKGAVKVLPFSEILQDWKDIVYFDFTPELNRIRNFHPIDFFIDEACVGAFLNESNKQDVSLYLYQFEGEPTDLHLNISGYIQMLVASKGFLYWQYAIIEILSDQENPVSQRFKEWMPQLFPDFNWQAYVQQYIQVKI